MFARTHRFLLQNRSVWPADSGGVNATELATIAGDLTSPLSQREQAWELLLPVIDRVARGAARRLGNSACEYVDHAPGLIFEKIHKFNPDFGRFESWCACVLRHDFIDLHRRFQRDALATAKTGRLTPTDPVDDNLDYICAMVEESGDVQARSIDLRLPFASADLDVIRALDAEDRVAVIVAFGLSHKVSSTEWDGWMQTLPRTARELPLADLDKADVPARIQFVAERLKRKYNSVYQRMKRKARKVLTKLRFAREFWSSDLPS